MAKAGDANLRTNLNAGDPLRAAIQAGSNLRTKLSAMAPDARARLSMAIDDARVKCEVSRSGLAYVAGVSAPHYERLCRVNGKAVSARFLIASLRGLKSVRAQAVNPKAPAKLEAAQPLYAACLILAAKLAGMEPDVASTQLARKGQHGFDALWRQATDARAIALYLASTELGIRGAVLATITGLTPAAVSLALNRIEERRDDEDFDAALEKAAQQVRGK